MRARDCDTLDTLVTAARACRACRLWRERTQVVTATGPANVDVVVVTDAPGYHDDRSGQLLSGPVADLVNSLLDEAGLSRQSVLLTSMVKCRPPHGRSPFPDEIDTCDSWLFREIALVKPRVIVTLGAAPLRLVTGRWDRLADVHGDLVHTTLQGRDVVVWPLYHPAAALHVPSLLEDLRHDVCRLGQLLRGATATAAPDAREVASRDDSAALTDDAPDDGAPQLALDI